MGNVLSNDKNSNEEHIEEEKSEDEDQPFDFAELPVDLQYKVIERLNYNEFSILDRTSRLGNTICWHKTYSVNYDIMTVAVNKKTVKMLPFCDYYNEDTPRVPWHVAARPPARIVAGGVKIESRVSSRRMQAVTKLFEENQTKAGMLELTQHITFEPADLDRLIKAIKASHLDCNQFVPRQFFAVEAVKNLETLTLFSCGLTDDELLRLKCPYIYVENDFITAKGLNRFLRQWKKKEREIHGLTIKFDTSFGTRNFEACLEGLEANLIWSPDFHEHSLVKNIKLNEFPPMETGDPEHIYCIFRPDEIENVRLLRLSLGQFMVHNRQGEAEFLYSFLNEDQFYVIRGVCYYCEVEFCEHRRKYSMTRLKKFYPRLYNCFMIGYRTMGNIFAALRIEKVLLCERPFTRPPLFEKERMQQESGFSLFLSNLRVLFFNHV